MFINGWGAVKVLIELLEAKIEKVSGEIQLGKFYQKLQGFELIKIKPKADSLRKAL